jgi:sugar phosphate isomerase/epimerase
MRFQQEFDPMTQANHPSHAVSRREFLKTASAGIAATALAPQTTFAQAADFNLRYILSSSMYGELSLDEILPEIHKIGATEIDLWPRVHGNQREQVDAMGHDVFLEKMKAHNVSVGMITRYDLGPYKLQDEMAVCKKLGGDLMVCGSSNAPGDTLKEQVAAFVENMKPHIEVAEKLGVTIAIENHGNALIESPDSLRYLAEMSPSPRLGIAYAPYHLPQDPEVQAQLIKDIAPALSHFYAWEHGMGSVKKLPKVQEMQQLPGYGPLNFGPILAALKAINFTGRTSIFMHPVPRGIPALPSATETTQAINRSREYLQTLLDGGLVGHYIK